MASNHARWSETLFELKSPRFRDKPLASHMPGPYRQAEHAQKRNLGSRIERELTAGRQVSHLTKQNKNHRSVQENRRSVWSRIPNGAESQCKGDLLPPPTARNAVPCRRRSHEWLVTSAIHALSRQTPPCGCISSWEVREAELVGWCSPDQQAGPSTSYCARRRGFHTTGIGRIWLHEAVGLDPVWRIYYLHG